MFGYKKLMKRVRLLELENARIKTTLRQVLDETKVDVFPEFPNSEEMQLRFELGACDTIND